MNTVGAKARVVLEVVVVGSGSALPVASAVGADLQLSDRLIGIDDLHREPVLGCTFLVLELKGTIEIARSVGPLDVDDTS